MGFFYKQYHMILMITLLIAQSPAWTIVYMNIYCAAIQWRGFLQNDRERRFDKRLAVENGSLNKLATPVIIIPTEMQIF